MRFEGKESGSEVKQLTFGRLPQTPFIPAKAGIQERKLGPRFRGDERENLPVRFEGKGSGSEVKQLTFGSVSV